MINIYGSQQKYNPAAHIIPRNEVWLRNQTFRIQGQLYTLIDRRGGGTFGSVWASISPNGRRAAVKVFDLRRIRRDINQYTLATSFQEEIRMTYRMRDATDHVVNIYGFDFDSRRHVALMAMELGDDSLEERVETLHTMKQICMKGTIGDDFISARDRKSIWVQLVRIILTLRRHHIVHRDLKPPNLMFFGSRMKIVDLGIAQKEVAGYNSQSIGGSPYYSAPECFTGEAPVTSKADIWSAGAILYYMTYGAPPMYPSLRPPPGVPRTRSAIVQDVLHHCLQRNPDHRASHLRLAQHPLTASPAIA